MRISEPFGDLPGTPVELERRPAARLANDLDFEPVDPVTDACSQGLGAGFFCGKSRRKALGSMALAQAVGLFSGRINPVQETSAKTVNRTLDAPNLDHVDPGANDHVDYKATTSAPETFHCLKAGQRPFHSATDCTFSLSVR
jgi:hypothetical protein